MGEMAVPTEKSAPPPPQIAVAGTLSKLSRGVLLLLVAKSKDRMGWSLASFYPSEECSCVGSMR